MSTSNLRDGTYFLSNESIGVLMQRWDDAENPSYNEETFDEYEEEIEFVDGNMHTVLLRTYTQGTARNFEFK